MLVCTRASRLPSVIVATAIAVRTTTHVALVGAAKASRKRSSTANPATLEAVEMYAVAGVGAPSYTSGVQKWNGTAEILKANPTKTRIAAPPTNKIDAPPWRPWSASRHRFVWPVGPGGRPQ